MKTYILYKIETYELLIFKSKLFKMFQIHLKSRSVISSLRASYIILYKTYHNKYYKTSSSIT